MLSSERQGQLCLLLMKTSSQIKNQWANFIQTW